MRAHATGSARRARRRGASVRTTGCARSMIRYTRMSASPTAGPARMPSAMRHRLEGREPVGVCGGAQAIDRDLGSGQRDAGERPEPPAGSGRLLPVTVRDDERDRSGGATPGTERRRGGVRVRQERARDASRAGIDQRRRIAHVPPRRSPATARNAPCARRACRHYGVRPLRRLSALPSVGQTALHSVSFISRCNEITYT